MNEVGPVRKNTTKKVLIVLPLLLFVAVAVNWETISEIVRGEQTVKGAVLGFNPHQEEEIAGWPMPADAGNKDAKVVIEVFCSEGDACHWHSAAMGEALGTIDPERIFVNFCSTHDTKVAKRVQDVELGCEQGFAVNGKTKFTAPAPDGGEMTLYLTGEGGWGLPQLYTIIDMEMKEVYDGKGLSMTQDEFAAQVDAATKEIADRMREESKARDAARKK